MKKQNSIVVSEHEIMVTIGGGQALSLAIQSSIMTGDGVIVISAEIYPIFFRCTHRMFNAICISFIRGGFL